MNPEILIKRMNQFSHLHETFEEAMEYGVSFIDKYIPTVSEMQQMKEKTPDVMITYPEAEQLLGVTRKTLQNHLANGRFKRDFKNKLLSKNAILKFIKKRDTPRIKPSVIIDFDRRKKERIALRAECIESGLFSDRQTVAMIAQEFYEAGVEAMDDISKPIIDELEQDEEKALALLHEAQEEYIMLQNKRNKMRMKRCS